jgi:hypothetical protein
MKAPTITSEVVCPRCDEKLALAASLTFERQPGKDATATLALLPECQDALRAHVATHLADEAQS